MFEEHSDCNTDFFQRVFQKVNYLLGLPSCSGVGVSCCCCFFTDTRVSVSKFSSWNTVTSGSLNYRSHIGITVALASGLTTGHVPSTVLGLF